MAKGGRVPRQGGGDLRKLRGGRRKLGGSKKGEKAIDFGIVGALIQSDAKIPIGNWRKFVWACKALVNAPFSVAGEP